MKKLSFFLTFLISGLAWSQDTVWVQTYTFDTIATRRAQFQFPQELDTMRFEKVLMYYKLKCSPLTTWDSYDCGEWDYLTYTRVFDHTGTYDSVRHAGSKFRVNTLSPGIFSWKSTPYFDKQYKQVISRTPGSVTEFPLAGAATTPLTLLNSGSNGTKLQFILSSAELLNAGVTAGNVEGLVLNFLETFQRIEGVSIRVGSTAQSSLTSWTVNGFTTVYDGVLTNITAGPNPVYFQNSFLWDGTSNLLIEISIADANQAASLLELQTQTGQTDGTISYQAMNGVMRNAGSDYAEMNFSQVDLGSDVTIAFWAKGNGSFGTNSTMIEAVDSIGNRILNVHYPWSNNNIYFDAGNQNGYDRIQKAVTAADIDNSWHFWAFVKNSAAGQMLIYKDGVLWHSGTNMTRPIGKVSRMTLTGSCDLSAHYTGDLDEFSLWNVPLDAAAVASLMNTKITAAHPDYANLQVYYDFDDACTLTDKSPHNRMAMPSDNLAVKNDSYPVTGAVVSSERPSVSIIQGTMNTLPADSVLVTKFPDARVKFDYAAGNNSFNVIQNQVVYPEGSVDTLNVSGAVIATSPSGFDQTATNDTLVYFDEPFEVINDVEIGRYITPYGIGFSLGANGFTWIYDVSDYQKYLHGTVDLAAHNTQELLDLKFAFVKGIPPRDVHNVEPVWNNWQSYNYAQMAQDDVLSATPVQLSDTSQMFGIKTRLSGHGQVGNTACCEWKPNDHKIYINGQERFTWNIWQTNECGENPNIKQGGTWPYAREGWCPGDMVKEHDFDITPYVSPGQTVSIDYGITPVTANDPAEGGGNYIAAFDLVSYSAPNFQHDAAIVDILNPNSYEYYSKFNPTCSNPRIILQNTGSQPLTSCIIRLWAVYGNWQEYTWTGNLDFLEKTIVEIPVTNPNFWFGIDMSHPVFFAQVYAVEGYPDLDEYAPNNVFKTGFTAVETVLPNFYVQFTTNNKANENKWRLVNADGDTLFERTTLANSTVYKDTFNLDPGCYSIILEDSDDDGIGFWYSSQVEGETTGSFYVRKIGGGNYEVFPTDFGSYHRYDFSVGFTLGLSADELTDKELQIYPNPATHSVHAEYNGYNGKVDSVELYDANGRKVLAMVPEQNGPFVSADIDISGLNAGYYLIHFSGQNGTLIGKVIKQ